CGEIREIADDAGRIVRWSGKRETDRNRCFGEAGLHFREALDEVAEAFLEVVGVGRQGHRVGDRLAATHGAEAEVRSAGVERQDNAGVVFEFHWCCATHAAAGADYCWCSSDRRSLTKLPSCTISIDS